MPESVIISTLAVTDTQSITNHLWACNAEGQTPDVYAILDGGRDRRISGMVHNSQLEYESMCPGERSYVLQRASPHIVKLEQENPLTQKIIEQGWGANWCIFLISHSTSAFNKLRYNCQKIAFVSDTAGQKLLFRYYDPRIMRVFLPTCTPEEAALVFGPVDEIIMEGEDSRQMIRFSLSEAASNVSPLALNTLRGENGLLKIRSVQMQAFQLNKHKQFENKAIEYIKKYFPIRYAEMGEARVLESIRDCVCRCQEYSIQIEKEVIYYLYHMYTLDFDFDQNDNEWAKQILLQKNLPVPVRLNKISQHFKAQTMHSSRLSR